MGKPKAHRTKPRRLKGFRDLGAEDMRARAAMIDSIREVYERYGFNPLESPALEYVDVLGKFLPEADQPDGGIFAFKDEDEEWIALRYDLTAPLSRFVAMNPDLPRPFRRYQVGPVWRVEKPGPDRFREFYQFDFDSVGTSSMLADAECCMVAADTLEALGIQRGEYIVRVNNRKVLNGLIELLAKEASLDDATSMNVLRCLDKLDKVGVGGVKLLLGSGRKDESGAFIKGLGLPDAQIELVERYLSVSTNGSREDVCEAMAELVSDSSIGVEGIDELREIDAALSGAGYEKDRVAIDPTIVRGLGYYTGPVFEAVLTFDVVDEKGVTRQFGSVFGGGRYDNLVERFTGQKVPATGASIGVDRLLAALRLHGKIDVARAAAPVLITQLDRSLLSHYQSMTAELRAAGVNTELYIGTQKNIGKQFKYASDSGKTVCVVMGGDELERGEVSIKDLRMGTELSEEIGTDRRKWLEEQPAQFTAARGELVESIRKVLARYE